ncbi:hypothetical protein CTAYLR_001157 [Chrysophaeum taylorii]|uniref:WW domain-containing protein n=1 Tax=Chrysophaeum taylorii TaxID=2483200 RepID=A0AAD7XS34_9STRA|nr:hypothetical protein CTAYLR_001157 [Chrysophaeum taylorii]
MPQRVVEALYSHRARHPGKLSFEKGDLIAIVDDKSDLTWWTGECNGHVGVFARYFVEEPRHFGIALFDCVADEEDELEFRKGDRIVILDTHSDHDDWWTGEVDGTVGTFPSNYARVVDDSELPEGWEQCHDEASGHAYYHHKASGVSQWHPPHAAKEEEDLLIVEEEEVVMHHELENRASHEAKRTSVVRLGGGKKRRDPVQSFDEDEDLKAEVEALRLSLREREAEERDRRVDLDAEMASYKKEIEQFVRSKYRAEIDELLKSQAEVDKLRDALENRTSDEDRRFEEAIFEARADELRTHRREIEALRRALDKRAVEGDTLRRDLDLTLGKFRDELEAVKRLIDSEVDAPAADEEDDEIARYKKEVETLKRELQESRKSQNYQIDHLRRQLHEQNRAWPAGSFDFDDDDDDGWQRRMGAQCAQWRVIARDEYDELWRGGVVFSSSEIPEKTTPYKSASFRRKRAAVEALRTKKKTIPEPPKPDALRTIAARKQYRVVARMHDKLLCLAWDAWLLRVAVLRYAQDVLLLPIRARNVPDDETAELATTWVLNLSKSAFLDRINHLRAVLACATPVVGAARYFCVDPPPHPRVVVTTRDHRVQYHPLPSSCVLADALNVPAQTLAKLLAKDNSLPEGIPGVDVVSEIDPLDNPELCSGGGLAVDHRATWWRVRPAAVVEEEEEEEESSLITSCNVCTQLAVLLDLDESCTVQCGIVTVKCLDDGNTHNVHVASTGGLVDTTTRPPP